MRYIRPLHCVLLHCLLVHILVCWSKILYINIRPHTHRQTNHYWTCEWTIFFELNQQPHQTNSRYHMEYHETDSPTILHKTISFVILYIPYVYVCIVVKFTTCTISNYILTRFIVQYPNWFNNFIFPHLVRFFALMN